MGFTPLDEDDSAISSQTSSGFTPLSNDDEIVSSLASEPQTPPTRSFLHDPIGALTSKEWWLRRPGADASDPHWWGGSILGGATGEMVTPEQAVTGPTLAVLNTLTPSLGDEIAAGGSSLIDALRGQDLKGAYEDRLAQARDIERHNPDAIAALQLAAGVKLPIGEIFSSAKGVLPAAGNVVKGTALGAALGGAYGFGAGEGDLANRIALSQEQAKTGALTGGVLQGGIEALQGAGNVGSSLGGAIADRLERAAVGTTPGDFTKSLRIKGAKNVGTANVESDLADAIRNLSDKKFFEGDLNPQALVNKSDAWIDDLSDSLNSTIKKVDKMREEINRPIFPQFKATQAYIDSTEGVEQEGLQQLFDKTIKIYREGLPGKKPDLDGSLQSMHDLKKKLYKKAYTKEGQEKSVLNKFIAQDLRSTIEKVTDGAIPKEASFVRDVNQTLGDLLDYKRIATRQLGKAEGASPATAFSKIMHTTGGVGLPALIGAGYGAVSDNDSILKGALKGAAAGIAMKSIASPTSQLALSKLAKSSGSMISDSAQELAAIAKASTPGFQSTLLPEKRARESAPVDAAMTKAEKRMDEKPKAPKTSKAQSAEVTNPLIKAVIAQESDKNPNAISKKGAIGLMQIMPATAKEIASDLGVKEYDLKDPETNQRFGEHYLGKMLKAFGGDLELALTAYNQGERRVKNLLKIHKASTLDEIISYLGPDGKAYAKSVINRMRKSGQLET